MPKVSVIIPSYNHEAYVCEAIQSVLDQDWASFELIIVDDGSTDGSLEVIQGFKDKRILVISQENQGAHAALNRGLSLAVGAYISVLNSDDVFAPNRLATLIPYLESHSEISLLGTYLEIIDEKGESVDVKHGFQDLPPWPLSKVEKSFRGGKDLREALWGENYLATTSNFVFRRKLFKAGLAFKPLRYVHDWDFALHATAHGEIGLIPQPLVKYRIHDRNTIRENEAAMIFEILWLLAVHLPKNISQKWLYAQAPEERISQLLHSIYAFGMDRVLSTMLLQGISQHPEKAMDLLQRDDPVRATYLAYIQAQLDDLDIESSRRGVFSPISGFFKRFFNQ